MISVVHTLTMILTVGAIIAISLTGRKGNFATARGQASPWLVTGAIIGTLVGGQATIGTAEMGYMYGFSGIWFTFGSALGCFVLFLLTSRLRSTGCNTLLEVIGKEFGKKAEIAGSLLSLFGMFFSIVAQQLACAALIRVIFPCSLLVALIASTVLMLVYVVLGGMTGAGRGGVAKLVMLYLACIVCGAVVLHHGCKDFSYINLFNRGLEKDVNSAISMILGVVATQSYAQAVWSGKDLHAARRGTLLSVILIPPIGLACTLVGIFMKSSGCSPSMAFPAFTMQFLPHWLGGIVMGTLLITIVGGATGIALGSSVIVIRDLFRIKTDKSATQVRLALVCIMLLSLGASLILSGSLMNDLGFLSLGLRAASILIPLLIALYLSGRVSQRYIIASMTCAVCAMLLLHSWFSPTLCGLAVGCIPILISLFRNNKSH